MFFERMAEYTPKSIWNMDDERLKALNGYLLLCEDALLNWDIENTYSYLRAVFRIISGKLRIEEYNAVVELFKKVEILRRDKPEGKVIEIYNQLDEIYIYINRLMKHHGLYFREGKDPSKAVLER